MFHKHAGNGGTLGNAIKKYTERQFYDNSIERANKSSNYKWTTCCWKKNPWMAHWNQISILLISTRTQNNPNGYKNHTTIHPVKLSTAAIWIYKRLSKIDLIPNYYYCLWNRYFCAALDKPMKERNENQLMRIMRCLELIKKSNTFAIIQIVCPDTLDVGESIDWIDWTSLIGMHNGTQYITGFA